jgi:dihydropteroate synthase
MKALRSFPKIMGILNVTPDSFSDGGKFNNLTSSIIRAKELIADGADIIDIGGESSRPGADEVDALVEIDRTAPLIKAIREFEPKIPISIDTTKAETALAAVKAGADIINDISGLSFEPDLADIAAKYDKSLVVMHIKGNPRTMQNNPEYKDLFQEVYDFLRNSIYLARTKGVHKIYADLGIGFGKTVDHNYELLRRHDEYLSLGVPMLLGISRKSLIGKFLNIESPLDRDAETAIIHTLMLEKQIDIIRVHNVKLHSNLRKLYAKLS